MADYQVTDKPRVSRSGRLLKKSFKLKQLEEVCVAGTNEKRTPFRSVRNKLAPSSSAKRMRKNIRDSSNSKSPRGSKRSTNRHWSSAADVLSSDEYSKEELTTPLSSSVVTKVNEEQENDPPESSRRSGSLKMPPVSLYHSSEETESSSSSDTEESESDSEEVGSESQPLDSRGTSNNESETSSSESKTSNSESKTSNSESKTSNGESKTSNSESKTSNGDEESSGSDDRDSNGSQDKILSQKAQKRTGSRKRNSYDPEYAVHGGGPVKERGKITSKNLKGNAVAKKSALQRRTVANAYALWRKMNWKKIRTVFGSLSRQESWKKVGEMWRSLPETERALWKRKARQLSLRSSSVSGETTEEQSKARSVLPPAVAADTTPEEEAFIGIAPIDCAARLKLLGDRLTATGVKIANLDCQPSTVGVYSVLLDSLLCSVVPLLCLAREITGLENLPEDVFLRMSDHIGYFLPGL